MRQWRLRQTAPIAKAPPTRAVTQPPPAAAPGGGTRPAPADAGRVWGAVEQLSAPSTLRGWARAGRLSDAVRVRVLRDETEIGTATTDTPRSDIGGINGFIVECREPITPGDLASGRVRVMGEAMDGANGSLQIVPRILSEAVFDVMRSVTGTLGDAEFDHLLKALAESPVLAKRRAELDALVHHGGRVPADALPALATLGALPPNPDRSGPQAHITMVGVPVGHLASDGSALIGHDGHAFLVAGGNNLLGQYGLDPAAPDMRRKVAAWIDLVGARAAQCRAAGRGFVQVMIPEKLTVMPELMPRQVRVPSTLWRGVESGLLADPSLAPHYVSALPILTRLAPRGEAFPRMDTHLAARATHELFLAICAAMGAGQPFADVPFTAERIAVGDLAQRFFPGVALPEVYFHPDPEAVAGWPSPELVERIDPGRHMGTRYVWRTPGAPITARVVAFGNSFFERGGDARSLSWWFARAFSEFHFLWEAEMQQDYIDRIAPDWVICQTIERFMPQVPAR